MNPRRTAGPITGSSSFIQDLLAGDSTENAFPISGTVELTRACNLACDHCYARPANTRRPELTTEQFRTIFEKLTNAEVLLLSLTGGEPLLRPDFRDLFSDVRRKGFLVSLFTNACLVDRETARFLKEWRVRRVEVSVYGFTKTTYEAVTGVAGSHAQYRQGIECLLEADIPCHFKMLVCRENADEFERLRNWAHELGVPFRYDVTLTPRLNGDPAPLACRLDPASAARLQLVDKESRHAFEHITDACEARPGEQMLECGAGTKTFHVDAYGQLHPCVLWRHDPYDLLHRSLGAEWFTHLARVRKRIARPDEACSTCTHWPVCANRCPGLSMLENGAVATANDYHCQLCRERSILLDTPDRREDHENSR